MKITLTQENIKEALSVYLRSRGLHVDASVPLNVEFSTTRKPTSISAIVDLTNGLGDSEPKCGYQQVETGVSGGVLDLGQAEEAPATTAVAEVAEPTPVEVAVESAQEAVAEAPVEVAAEPVVADAEPTPAAASLFN